MWKPPAAQTSGCSGVWETPTELVRDRLHCEHCHRTPEYLVLPAGSVAGPGTCILWPKPIHLKFEKMFCRGILVLFFRYRNCTGFLTIYRTFQVISTNKYNDAVITKNLFEHWPSVPLCRDCSLIHWPNLTQSITVLKSTLKEEFNST